MASLDGTVLEQAPWRQFFRTSEGTLPCTWFLVWSFRCESIAASNLLVIRDASAASSMEFIKRFLRDGVIEITYLAHV